MVAQVIEDRSYAEAFEARLSPLFNEKSLELARRYGHLTTQVRHVITRRRTTLFEVRSSAGQKIYTICADRSGCVWCECLAASFNRPCRHVGAVVAFLQAMFEASVAYVSSAASETALHTSARALEELERKQDDHGEHAACVRHGAHAVSIFK